jgi:hypothetical protein
MSHNPKAELADDLIWGVGGPNGIAAELKISPQRAYYLVATNKIPTKKLGHRTITASRSALRRFFGGSETVS